MAGRHRYGGRRRYHFHLAIIGRSNSGKSALIKALILSRVGSVDVLPKTDFLECTEKCEKFEIPGSRIVLWDIPGCGTQRESLEGYDKRINMEKYNGFIICCAGPVTEYEMALNNLIAGIGRRYIFVRTKTDIAVENEKRAHPTSFNESEILKSLRHAIVDKLSESGVTEFLVSSRHPDKFDFETLATIVFDDQSLALFMESSNRKVAKESK